MRRLVLETDGLLASTCGSLADEGLIQKPRKNANGVREVVAVVEKGTTATRGAWSRQQWRPCPRTHDRRWR